MAKLAVSFVVGRLLCRQLRDYLAAQKVRGADIEWHESSGWLEREFTIGGEDCDVRRIAHEINLWYSGIEKQ